MRVLGGRDGRVLLVLVMLVSSAVLLHVPFLVSDLGVVPRRVRSYESLDEASRSRTRDKKVVRASAKLEKGRVARGGKKETKDSPVNNVLDDLDLGV